MRTKLRCSENEPSGPLTPESSSPDSDSGRRKGKKRLSLCDEIILNARIKTSRVNEDESKLDAFPNSDDEFFPTPFRPPGICGPPPAHPFYGLPLSVQKLFEELRGIKKLYEWQDKCLKCQALEENRNLIISLPTSGGKTLVAEILLLQQIILHKKDVLLILPFVSIVQEKIKGLIPFGLSLGFLVEEYAAAKGRIPPTKRRRKNSVYVATIEKAQSLVNSLIEEGRMDSLGMVIVDELHMIGESGRGVAMEQCLAKVQISTQKGCQIVGMSATLSNIKDLQLFLNAELFSSDFRPIELKEYVKLDFQLFEIHPQAKAEEEKIKFARQLPVPKSQKDPDALVPLVEEVIPKSSCMIFCSSKKSTENVAELLAELLSDSLKKHEVPKKLQLLRALKEEGESSLCKILVRCIPYGVAYHHSGLTAEERRLIQEAYLEGVLCVICCTSTLAAGVNLPAKRVILRSPFVGRDPISLQQYKQMSGRAGRAGLDTHGESIMILQAVNKFKFMETVSEGFKACYSQLLENNGKGMKTLLLSLVAMKVVTSRSDVDSIRTLLSLQQGNEKSKETKQSPEDSSKTVATVSGPYLDQLIEEGLLKISKHGLLETTEIGTAAFKGPIDSELASRLHTDLSKALGNGLILSNYLHLLHCAVPYDVLDEIKVNWTLFYDEYRLLDDSEKRVLNFEGLSEGLLVKNMSKRNGASMSADRDRFARSYVAVMLNRLWKQEKVWNVARRYDVPRGWLQSLLQSSAAYASCVARFCQHVEKLWAYDKLLPGFVQRLTHCVNMELIPLMDIHGVKTARARQLFAAGYKSISDIADADPATLVEKIDNLSRSQAQSIVANARMKREEEFSARVDEIQSLFRGSEPKVEKMEQQEEIVRMVADELLPSQEIPV